MSKGSMLYIIEFYLNLKKKTIFYDKILVFYAKVLGNLF